MLRSVDPVDKGAASVAWGWWAAPHPRAGAGVELGGGDAGGQGDLRRVGEALPGKGLAANRPPPALLQVAPARAGGDEHLPDAGMVNQPGAGAVAAVAAVAMEGRRSCPANSPPGPLLKANERSILQPWSCPVPILPARRCATSSPRACRSQHSPASGFSRSPRPLPVSCPAGVSAEAASPR